MKPRILRRRYRLIEEIGRGGAGAVYLAEDTRLPGRQCAIKEIPLIADRGSDQGSVEADDALRAEALVLTRLDHPALPKVSDFFEDRSKAYLVMDFVPGQDLRNVLTEAWRHDRPLREDQVLRWNDELCDALMYLHRQSPPVIHRDVKPANVKLTPDGQIRLVDFGLARPATVADGRTVTVLADAGSRPYQPLEQYGEGRAVSPAADIYALGATLYHLLSGRAPPSAQERFLDAESLAPLRELRSELSPELARAIQAAMALHPDDRPESIESFRRLLGPATGSHDGNSMGEALRANVWLVAAVIVLFLAALAMSVSP